MNAGKKRERQREREREEEKLGEKSIATEIFFSFLTFGAKEEMSIKGFFFSFYSFTLCTSALSMLAYGDVHFFLGNLTMFFALSLAIRMTVEAFLPGMRRIFSNHLDTMNIPVQGLFCCGGRFFEQSHGQWVSETTCCKSIA